MFTMTLLKSHCGRLRLSTSHNPCLFNPIEKWLELNRTCVERPNECNTLNLSSFEYCFGIKDVAKKTG